MAKRLYTITFRDLPAVLTGHGAKRVARTTYIQCSSYEPLWRREGLILPKSPVLEKPESVQAGSVAPDCVRYQAQLSLKFAETILFLLSTTVPMPWK